VCSRETINLSIDTKWADGTIVFFNWTLGLDIKATTQKKAKS